MAIEWQPEYKCPVCGEYEDLRVLVTGSAHILQEEEESSRAELFGEVGDYWSDTSPMYCWGCGHGAEASQFENPDY